MVAKVYVDGILAEWGSRMFVGPVSGRAAAPMKWKPHAGKSQSRASAKKLNAVQVRKTLNTLTKRTPEVMVKISGGGRSMKSIGAHMDYISRNGQVELENEAGEIIKGRDDVAEIKREWSVSGYGIRDEERRNAAGKSVGAREAFNIVLSMPPGTDREAVRRAAREFAAAEFGGRHHYVMAQHDDEEHPHVHLCVRARSYVDQKRLNPRKADLQAWRERFAGKLRDNGIEAAATKRPVRGRTHATEKLPLVKMRERGVTTKKQVREPQQHPAFPEVMTGYEKIARALAHSDDAADRQLAVDVTKYVSSMEAIKQPQAATARGRGIDRQQGRDRAAQQLGYRTEIENERPDYSRFKAPQIRTERGLALARAGVRKPGVDQSRRVEPTRSIAGMRNVSGLDVAHNQRSAEMLLHANARDRMAGGRSADHDVRRTRGGDRGDIGDAGRTRGGSGRGIDPQASPRKGPDKGEDR
ncbi:relaxase/mobilization nuclease domain-containing protein [Burkholderia sp. Ac-20345]|uniref:relaxase/mobilization nuclease domain-containing protein n=1 Tax=Burkholderia sp. Ac-20345 TaxID=2703891 RepID=UPI00197C8431|nr:relaxase/mobilization nuclease domain-containing protein [Burkholderia sp. Ac-20345]MBN3780474.1 relaxase/mobilization nuclease domain-containing protein [Burkholderia sp. Ac-20345]